MEQISQINWEPILWIGGFFMAVITGLLTWIGAMSKRASDKIEIRSDRIEAKLTIHDKEIHDIALSNREILTVMKHKFKIK